MGLESYVSTWERGGNAMSVTDTAGRISFSFSAAVGFQMFILENTSPKDHSKIPKL